jgi:hypothetical protein
VSLQAAESDPRSADEFPLFGKGFWRELSLRFSSLDLFRLFNHTSPICLSSALHGFRRQQMQMGRLLPLSASEVFRKRRCKTSNQMKPPKGRLVLPCASGGSGCPAYGLPMPPYAGAHGSKGRTLWHLATSPQHPPTQPPQKSHGSNLRRNCFFRSPIPFRYAEIRGSDIVALCEIENFQI